MSALTKVRAHLPTTGSRQLAVFIISGGTSVDHYSNGVNEMSRDRRTGGHLRCAGGHLRYGLELDTMLQVAGSIPNEA